MIKQPIKIAILGYEEFIIKAQKYINAIENVDIVAHKSYGIESLALARKLEAEGVDVIIAGRINCKYIKGELDIPVVEIHATVIDFLNAFNAAKQYNCDTIALSLPDFSVYDIDFDSLGEMTGLKIIRVTHNTPEELQRKLKELKNRGIQVVVGNILTILACEKIGLNGIYVYSMESAIMGCIDKAIEVVQIKRAEMAKKEHETSALDYSTDGIIQINSTGEIIVFNHTARKIFHLENEPVFGKKCEDIIPDLNLEAFLTKKKPEYCNVEQINLQKMLVSRIPILLPNGSASAIAVFHSSEDIDQMCSYLKRDPKNGFHAKYTFDSIIGRNSLLLRTIEISKKYARTNLPVLIEGETGTGKELFAQSIHNYSLRSKGPFVAINCAALSPSLLESELFGYEPGAFTGASRNGRIGLFELADKGTLFLDEINSIPLSIQVKLLRTIEEREIIRVGGNRIIPIDVRIISSSNADLSVLCKKNEFRSDLFFRIGTLRISIPPLRNRREDIPLLIDALSDNHTNKSYLLIRNSLVRYLQNYSFPGNVRELRGFLERIFLLTDSESILSSDEIDLLIHNSVSIHTENCDTPSLLSKEKNENIYGNDSSAKDLLHILEECRFNKTEAAKKLNISRSTLYRKMMQAGLL